MEGSTPDSEVKYLHDHETKGHIGGKELDSNVLLSRHHSTVTDSQWDRPWNINPPMIRVITYVSR